MLNVVILGLVSLLTDLSAEMIYPLVPLYLVSRLGATPALVGLIEGTVESLASLLRVVFGQVADRARRRKPLVILGYSASALSRVVMYLAGSWGLVYLARGLDRFGKGVRSAPRDALIADGVPQAVRGRGFGLHRLLDSAGAAAGAGVAFFALLRWADAYRSVFLASLIPGVCAVLVLALVRETPRARPWREAAPVCSATPGGAGAARPRAPGLLSAWPRLDRRLKGFLLLCFLFSLGNSSNQFLLLRAQSSGYSPATVVLLYLLYNLVYSLTSYPAGRLSDRVGRKAVITAGFAAYALVYLGFAHPPGVAWFWALFLAYGVYSGLTDGVEKALVVDLAPAELRATLVGLHSTLVGVALFPASLLAGVLWNAFGPAAPFYLGSATAALAALGLQVVLRAPSRGGAPAGGRRKGTVAPESGGRAWD
ncbi:MAG: MFS transporter [Acetobacteraceae bacterium]|nr:MFS transporter [Acetobacteraceae bacterium]